MIPMMDGIKEYLGMMHELPDFVQINRVSVCVCLSLSVCLFLCHVFHNLDYGVYYVILCHTQGSQGKVKESERLKDDGRLDVSITVHFTDSNYWYLSDGRGIRDPVKNRNCCYYAIR